MDYAVIRTGGKQYRVASGDVIRIEKVVAAPGTELQFTDVLMTSSSGAVRVGTPRIEGARVTAHVIRQDKAKKLLIFKKKRRKNYRRRQGHRQHLTTIRVATIETGVAQHGA